MRGSNQHRKDEASKASARAGTTVVPNLQLDSVLQDDAEPSPSGNVQSNVPAKVSGAAMAPPPTTLQPSISREEADLQQKEREKQRAPRIAVVPNLAHLVQDNPSASYTHVSPIGQSEPVVAKSPATATIAPPKTMLRLAPAVPSPLHQPNQDTIIKQRERNARPTVVVSNQAEDLLRARSEAATLAMPENPKQEDLDQLLEDDSQHQTTYQTYRQQQPSGESFLGQVSSEMGRRKRPSSNANGRAQANLDQASRPDLTPGALAVSDGIAQRLNKAVLTHVETTNAPDYVAPVDQDAFEGPRTQGIYGTIHPMDQQMLRESENVIEGQSVMKINDMEYNRTHPRRKWYIVGAAVLIVIIVIAVSVALAPGGKPNDPVGATEGSTGSTVETERRIALRKALVALRVSSMEQLTDPNEAQYDALTWLSDVDTDTVVEDTLNMTQRYVLAVFYYSMNGPAWTNTSDWLNPSKNVCDWLRIGCLDGEVSAITEVEPINMEGVLPTELDVLSLLKTLVIGKNAVHGFAGPLNVLTDLTLNEASLGERFKDIPTTILEMTNLQRLVLHSNGLIGTIPTEIEKLSSLNFLDLTSNNLYGTLPTQLTALRNLTAFSVMQNQFDGDVFKIIGEISNLSVFSGSFNSFTGTIGTEIATLSNLVFFAMRQNKLSGSLPNFLFNISSLVVLDLPSNQLTGTLSSAIGELEKLEILSLSNTRVSGSIPSEIGRVSLLQNLHAENCSMVGVIPTEIGRLTNMTSLTLSNNAFQGTIPTELGSLGKLGSLHLDGNSLTGPIPSQLGQLTLLTSFTLVNNDLSGNLPSEICAIPSLARVNLVGAFPRDGLSCGDCAKCI